MQPAIGYLRVSTQEQGRSGLGLAAQRHDIEVFSEREGFVIRSWHQDIQTGAGRTFANQGKPTTRWRRTGSKGLASLSGVNLAA
jgi:hypothetical protein